MFVPAYYMYITESVYKLTLCAISAAGMQNEAPGQTSLEDDNIGRLTIN